MAYLVVIGFVSILGQVAILRELSVAFYGVELIYSLAIGVWLLWTACGAMISRRTLRPSVFQINLLLILFSLALPLDAACIRSIRLLFSSVPGAYLPLHTQIAAMSAALLPVGLILGLLFQWAAKAYVAGGKSLAAAYSIECLGGLAGGLCATLFLKFGFQNFWITLFCSLAALGSSFLHENETKPRWFRPGATLALGLLIACVWKAPAIDRTMTSWTHPTLVGTRDTPYCRVTVSSMGGQISVFENDALTFETEGTEAEEFVHLAALQHPGPGRVLILGGGLDGTIHEILQYAPRAVDYVELNSALLDLAVPFLRLEVQKSLRAGNVRTIIADPRRFLDKSGSYDLILAGMPEPTSGQTNRYYTREFFQQCFARLNSSGVMAFKLQSSENIWTPQLTLRMASIYRAAKSAFADVLVLPGSTGVVIGSREPLTRNPSVLIARFNARGIKARLVSAAYLQYVYKNDRFLQIADALKSRNAPINSDVRPACYQYTIMIWLSKFFPSISAWDFPLPESRSGRLGSLLCLMALALPALFFLSRARWSVRRALLVGVAAFIGMVLETLLILHFQVKQGVLYQDLGVLLMAFMAGLALGAMAVDSKSDSQTGGQLIPKGWGTGLLSGFVLLSAFVGYEINSGRDAGLLVTSALLLLAGFFVAGVFAYASLDRPDDQRKIITLLYSADLIGGCLGSIASSLVLVPLIGLGATAQWMIPLSLIAALFL